MSERYVFSCCGPYSKTDMMSYEPVQDKTYNKTFETNKDSDQPVNSPSMARFLIYPSLDSLEAVEGTYDQQRL